MPVRSPVTIIIPQRNRADLTIACIRSVRAHDPVVWPILVVDDGSDLAELRRVQSAALPGVEILPQPRCGVTAAWNAGWRRARSDHVLFLNNDVLASGPWVERLGAPLADPDVRMTGCAARRETSVPESLLQRLPTRNFLEGWCFALRADDLRNVAGFDAALRVYFSDTDLQCRLLIARNLERLGHTCRGGRLHAVPDLPLEHAGHGTARHDPRRRTLWRADRRTFLARWEQITSEYRVA